MGEIDNNGRMELTQIISAILEYDLEVETFMEIGSKDGHDAAFLADALSLKSKNVYILEAHPAFYKMIMKTYPHYKVFNMAAWNETTQIEFNAARNRDDGRSSLLSRNIYNSPAFIKTMVNASRLDDFLIRENIAKVDVMKIDVEGAAFEVLKGLGSALEEVKLIQVETELKKVWKDQRIKEEVFEFMTSSGFKLIWDTDVGNTQNDSVWVKSSYVARKSHK